MIICSNVIWIQNDCVTTICIIISFSKTVCSYRFGNGFCIATVDGETEESLLMNVVYIVT